MAGKADEIIIPITTDKIPVQNKSAKGNSKVNGAAPKTENQITYLRPNLSPKGPPSNVPTAEAAKYQKR